MRFWWQSFIKKNPEKDVAALTESLKSALGARLKGVVVFGSLASGEFDSRHSNINVLVLADLSLDSLQAIGPALRAWLKHGHLPPVLVDPEGLDDFARDFPIEFLDMQDSHRVLYGEGPLSRLAVDKRHLEAQCEHDLALNQLRLRQAIALAGGDSTALRRALLRSLPSVLTLLRVALRLEDENAAKIDKIKAAEKLGARVGFDAHALHLLNEVRMRRSNDNVTDLTAHCLSIIGQVLQHLRKR